MTRVPGLVVEGARRDHFTQRQTGVTFRVEEDPEGPAGLVRVAGRAEIEYCRLGCVEVVNDHVEVHLLGWPRRRRVPVHVLD
jgi:hypothetical protein